MKMNHCLMLIVLLASVVLYRVAAESKVIDGTSDTKAKGSGNDSVNGTANPVTNGKDINSNGNSTIKQSASKEGVSVEQKNGNKSASKDEQKQNKGSDSRADKGSETVKLPVVTEICDSLSNRCNDNDKTLVACLRVPGNESPERSLLIQNKGKGPLGVTISASDSIHLEKKEIQLQEKEVAELKVTVKGVGNGQFIMLRAGHGDCHLDISGQSMHDKKKLGGDSKSTFFNLSQQTYSIAFLFLAALATAVSVLMCVFLRRRFARKALKYQMLDMELPVSHGSQHERGANEGWDDSWGDNWDDEEAPTTPSFPVTPSLSAKGIASRKYNKVGRMD